MGNWTDRTELLLGKEKLQRLQNAHVLVAGLGGVGGYAAEHLCRAGIGKMTIVDGDAVSNTNRNRQLLAFTSTQGQRKAQLMAQRLKDINPDLEITATDDIADSHSCKLALYMRKRLHKLGVRTGFKVVFSPEPIPPETMIKTENLENKKTIVGTISYMPAVFGAMCASVVIRDITS